MAKLPHINHLPRRSSAQASPSVSNRVIEYSDQRLRDIDIETRFRESQAFWASPEGKIAEEKQERAKRNRKPLGIKFPESAGKGTKPSFITGADQALISRYL